MKNSIMVVEIEGVNCELKGKTLYVPERFDSKELRAYAKRNGKRIKLI